MARHAARDRRSDFVRLTRRVLGVCLALTVVSTVLATAVGPVLLRFFFGFREGLGVVTFLAMGVSVGLYLAAMILAAGPARAGHARAGPRSGGCSDWWR